MSQYHQRIGDDRRVHQRFEDARASLVELAGDNSGIVLNISEGGMAILSSEDLDLNDLQNLRFQAPEFEHWIETAADVAWISDSKKQAGIRFKGLSEAVRTQLRAGISIATVRARWAEQSKKAAAKTERPEELTDATPSPVATTNSATVVDPESEPLPDDVNSNSLTQQITENQASLNSEVQQATPYSPSSETISDEVNANSLAQETHADKAPSSSEVQQAPPDSPSPEARAANEPANDPQNEIATKEKSILPQEPKKDARSGPLALSGIEPINPQKTSTAVAFEARPSPLALQKSAFAEIRFRNLVANSGVKQSGTPRERSSNRADTSYGKWAAAAALAILGSLLAFLVGWLLGDPNVIKLRH